MIPFFGMKHQSFAAISLPPPRLEAEAKRTILSFSLAANL